MIWTKCNLKSPVVDVVGKWMTEQEISNTIGNILTLEQQSSHDKISTFAWP